jgi:hypothetical protein
MALQIPYVFAVAMSRSRKHATIRHESEEARVPESEPRQSGGLVTFGFTPRSRACIRDATLMVVIERSLASCAAAVGGTCADERPPCEKCCDGNALGDHRRTADSW